MAELNEPQLQAVAHTVGPLIVFAGAGSGKTRTITYRIANLLANGTPPYRILAVTFTNKAAGEMRERLEKLGGEVTRDLFIGTFHSVCARLLRRHHAAVGLGRNFVIYDDSDQKALLGRALKDMGLNDANYPPKLVLSLISKEKREGYLPEQSRSLGRLESTLCDVYDRYQAALLRADAVDFDDLLLYVMRIAESETPDGQGLRSRFSYVLVDEFQDTNLIQYRLIHALSRATRNLCVVGDDDQSIYRWRGADVRLIRNFRRDFPDATLIKLEQNYRSSRNIVQAALGVIQCANDREPKELWTEAEPGEKVMIRSLEGERDEATFVAGAIRGALSRGQRGQEIAVFYRVHAQSRALEEALRSMNLPYQIIGGMKFFERAEVKDLLSYLRFSLNPKSDTDLLRIINVPPRGIGDKTVERISSRAAEDTTSAFEALSAVLDSDELTTAVKKKLFQFRKLMLDLQEQAEKIRPSELARRALDASGYEAALREDDSAEADARLGNLEELVGAISEYERELEGRDEEPTLAGYLERISLIANVDTMTDGSQVSLMTVHSAKGLEFDTVFLTGMEESIFPYKGVDQGRGDSEEDLDEERRLAYVAITRARRRLVITHVGTRLLFGRSHYLTASRFLDDIPPEVSQREGTRRAPASHRFGAPEGYRFGSSSAYATPYPSASRAPAAPRAALAPGTRIVERDEYSDPGEEQIRPGTAVMHEKFGRGIVEAIEPGSSPIIVTRFKSVGQKRIKAEFLKLA
jgi:DNA helicase-2/ATP-dependent DNA helicase PcrA